MQHYPPLPFADGRVRPLPLHHADPANLGPVLAYWQRLRAGRRVPARTDLDPEAIRAYLPHSGIVERHTTGRVSFRLAGRKLEVLTGMALRGMPLRSLFRVAHRARFEALLREVFEGPRVMTLSLSAARAGEPLVTADLLLLPLSDQRGEMTRALAVLTPVDRPTGVPHRFDIRRAHLAAPESENAARPPVRKRPDLRVISGGLV